MCELRKMRRQKSKCFIIFDRDGTLTPISPDPRNSEIEPPIKEAIKELNSIDGIQVAILSARGLQDLRRDFPSSEIILSGNYGLEIQGPNGESFFHPLAIQARPILKKAKEDLSKAFSAAEIGVILEDHEFSVCIHWHKTKIEERETLDRIINNCRKSYPSLTFNALPTSYEISTVANWNKSNGLDKTLELAGFTKEETFLLYAGDSGPDEPAYDWINSHGAGISIHIGESKSRARFSLAHPSVLHELIFAMNLIFSASRRKIAR